MKQNKALYAGSFDPVTLGHFDIIKRASHLFDELIVGIAVNTRKSPLLTIEERLMLLDKTASEFPNVKTVAYQGMTIEYARKIGATVLIRGLRNPSDFQIEFQMAITNRTLAPELETVYFPSDPSYTFINSCLVREIGASKGDITPFVPTNICALLKELMASKFSNS